MEGPKKCPFRKFKPCDPACELYEEDIRKPDHGPAYTVRGCSLRIGIETMKSVNQRLAMLQSEMGETKHAANNMSMAIIGVERAKQEIMRVANKNFGAPQIKQ